MSVAKRWPATLGAALVIGIWFALAAIGGPYFGRVSEVAENDAAAFLPQSSESAQVQAAQAEFSQGGTVPAVLLITSEGAISEGDFGTLQGVVSSVIADTKVVDSAEPLTGSPLIPAEDGTAGQAFIAVPGDSNIGQTVDQIRLATSAALTDAGLGELTSYVTGPAGFAADLIDAFGGIDGLLLLVAGAAVLIILIGVYRSPILPIAVLLTSVFALSGALLTVWWGAKLGWFTLTGQTQGILFILVIGAATDYGLLYTARYREELQLHDSKFDATKAAIRGTIEPITASGGTVIAGLLCLLLSDLSSNSSLGPVAATGIVFAMLAGLTMLPALLLLLGRRAFWPRKILSNAAAGNDKPDFGGLSTTPQNWYGKVGYQLARRPRTVWLSATAVLLVGAMGILGLNANGVSQSDLVLGTSEARDGQQALAKHFPGGSGSPTFVLASADKLDAVANVLEKHPGVTSAAPLAEQTFAAPGQQSDPIIANGSVMFSVTLSDAADSPAATQTVQELREEFSALGEAGQVKVGGTTAVSIDSNAAAIHDRNLIIPIVLLLITIILMVLLRAVLAPILLVATTALSFLTAMGVSSLIFNHLLHLPGADPAVPLYGFVFLVALGIDYNIFLMTRVREESLAHGTRPGILRGLTVTGPVITSAGIVLAATFAALVVIPIVFLLQLAIIVAFGVLLDTFLVRTLLVPALTYDIGGKIWWPASKPS